MLISNTAKIYQRLTVFLQNTVPVKLERLLLVSGVEPHHQQLVQPHTSCSSECDCAAESRKPQVHEWNTLLVESPECVCACVRVACVRALRICISHPAQGLFMPVAIAAE